MDGIIKQIEKGKPFLKKSHAIVIWEPFVTDF